MTEKEKETIEYWKRALNHYEYTKDLDLASDNYFGQFEEKINMISGMLNLIQKQQEEINRLNAEQKYDANMIDLMDKVTREATRLYTETNKKDKVIDLMAEQLTTPLNSKDWVIKHYKELAENEQ